MASRVTRWDWSKNPGPGYCHHPHHSGWQLQRLLAHVCHQARGRLGAWRTSSRNVPSSLKWALGWPWAKVDLREGCGCLLCSWGVSQTCCHPNLPWVLIGSLSCLEPVSLLCWSPEGLWLSGRVGFKNSDWGAVRVGGRSHSHLGSHH